MELAELEDWLRLAIAPGVGEAKLVKLITQYGDPRSIFHVDKETLKHQVGEEAANGIDNIKGYDVKRFVEIMDKLNIQLIPMTDAKYPKVLLQLSVPPPMLFVRGELRDEDTRGVAIVGARKATNYGRNVAHHLAYELARMGVTIISGMARGIDTEAHKGALEANGRTVAVWGSGLDWVYPAENRYLATRIINNGACVSEFPPRTRPEAGNFPRRNRIISALSKAVIVVEAAITSGVMHTVRWALELGRDVLAVPGNITSRMSEGTNMLIAQGAHVITKMEDVFELLNIDYKVKKVEVELTDEEQSVLEVLTDEPQHVDDIAERLNMPVQRLTAILLTLELKRQVKQLPGRNFIRLP